MKAVIERLTTHPSGYRWTQRLLGLLGQIPDQHLAQTAGIHPQTVTHERQRRGITAYAPRREAIEWTPKMVKLLGTASDRTVAALLGIKRSSVHRTRKLLNIVPFREPPYERTGYAWPPRALRLLGKMSDRDVAKRLGISASAVQFKRNVLAIPPFAEPQQKIKWTDEMLRLLGRSTDRDFVKRFPMTLKSVQLKREELSIAPRGAVSRKVVRNAELAALLALPNREVRRLAQVSKVTVYKLRCELGVPAPDTRRWRWTQKNVALLGKQPDATLATKLKLSPSAVGYMRRALDIAPYNDLKERWKPRARSSSR